MRQSIIVILVVIISQQVDGFGGRRGAFLSTSGSFTLGESIQPSAGETPSPPSLHPGVGNQENCNGLDPCEEITGGEKPCLYHACNWTGGRCTFNRLTHNRCKVDRLHKCLLRKTKQSCNRNNDCFWAKSVLSSSYSLTGDSGAPVVARHNNGYCQEGDGVKQTPSGQNVQQCLESCKSDSTCVGITMWSKHGRQRCYHIQTPCTVRFGTRYTGWTSTTYVTPSRSANEDTSSWVVDYPVHRCFSKDQMFSPPPGSDEPGYLKESANHLRGRPLLQSWAECSVKEAKSCRLDYRCNYENPFSDNTIGRKPSYGEGCYAHGAYVTGFYSYQWNSRVLEALSAKTYGDLPAHRTDLDCGRSRWTKMDCLTLTKCLNPSCFPPYKEKYAFLMQKCEWSDRPLGRDKSTGKPVYCRNRISNAVKTAKKVTGCRNPFLLQKDCIASKDCMWHPKERCITNFCKFLDGQGACKKYPDYCTWKSGRLGLGIGDFCSDNFSMNLGSNLVSQRLGGRRSIQQQEQQGNRTQLFKQLTAGAQLDGPVYVRLADAYTNIYVGAELNDKVVTLYGFGDEELVKGTRIGKNKEPVEAYLGPYRSPNSNVDGLPWWQTMGEFVWNLEWTHDTSGTVPTYYLRNTDTTPASMQVDLRQLHITHPHPHTPLELESVDEELLHGDDNTYYIKTKLDEEDAYRYLSMTQIGTNPKKSSIHWTTNTTQKTPIRIELATVDVATLCLSEAYRLHQRAFHGWTESQASQCEIEARSVDSGRG